MALKATSALTSKLKTHLSLCNFTPVQVNSLLGDIMRWESCNGPEWTVTRLKVMKDSLVQQFSNKEYLVENQFDWVSKKPFKQYRIPKGVWGTLFKLGLSSDSIKPLIKALSALMAYTGFKSKVMTNQQAKKTIEAFTKPFTGDEEFLRSFTNSVISFHNLKRNAHLHCGPLEYEFSFAGLNSAKPNNQFEKTWLGSFQSSLAYRPVMRFLRKNFGLPEDVPVTISASKWSTLDMLPGSISVIQERGFKSRVVAMPSSGIQVCLKPLHNALAKINKNLKEDCTYDHELGAKFAQESLAMGKKVYSVDLSSATDRFPRSLSLAILRNMGLNDEADLIDQICNDEWGLSGDLKDFYGSDVIRYSVGQPQGMYASFPLFAFSHHLVVKTIAALLYQNNRISKEDYVHPLGLYRILGDDIVFNNDILAQTYIRMIQRLGVEISKSKSIISNNIAEFASFLIGKSFYNKPKKVPNAEFFSSYLTYVKTFGYDAIKLVPKRIQPALITLCELPEIHGGLGMNPKGKPLYVRESIIPYLYKRRTAPKGVRLVSHLFKMSLSYPSMKDSLMWLYEQCSYIEESIKYSLPGMAKDIITDHKEEIFQLKADLNNSNRINMDLYSKYRDSVSYSQQLLNKYNETCNKFSGYEVTVAETQQELYLMKDSYKQSCDETTKLQTVISALKSQLRDSDDRLAGLARDLDIAKQENQCLIDELELRKSSETIIEQRQPEIISHSQQPDVISDYEDYMEYNSPGL